MGIGFPGKYTPKQWKGPRRRRSPRRRTAKSARRSTPSPTRSTSTRRACACVHITPPLLVVVIFRMNSKLAHIRSLSGFPWVILCSSPSCFLALRGCIVEFYVCVKDLSRERKTRGYASDRSLNLVAWTFCTDLLSANPSNAKGSASTPDVLSFHHPHGRMGRHKGMKSIRQKVDTHTHPQAWYCCTVLILLNQCFPAGASSSWIGHEGCKSGRGEFAAHELRLSRSESLPAHDDVVVTSSSSLTDMPALLPCCMHSSINRMNLINRWSNLGIFKCRRFESHYFIKKRPVPKNCTRSNEFARVLFRVAPPNSL